MGHLAGHEQPRGCQRAPAAVWGAARSPALTALQLFKPGLCAPTAVAGGRRQRPAAAVPVTWALPAPAAPTVQRAV